MFESGHLMASRGQRELLAAFLVIILLAIAVLAVLGLAPWLRSQPSLDAIGGPFTLMAGNGQKVADQDFRGKWLLVYFGYTRCPYICPTTLAEISETLSLLGPLAAEIQPFFITIDPERDTSTVVGEYVASFDDRIVGLSGTPAEIAAVAKEYRAYYKKTYSAPNEEIFMMEHTAFIYVMGPDGKYVTLLAPRQRQTPNDMAVRLRELITRARRG